MIGSRIFFGLCSVGDPGGGGFITGVGPTPITVTQTDSASVFVPPTTAIARTGHYSVGPPVITIGFRQIPGIGTGPPIITVSFERTVVVGHGPPPIVVSFDRVASVGLMPPSLGIGIKPTDVLGLE